METLIAQASCPPIFLSRCRIPRGSLTVVREDLLPGGTKQRAATPFAVELAAQGYSELTYASPFCGFAQIALAIAARAAGVKLKLFSEKEAGQASALTLRAKDLGATIELANTLDEAETAATTYGERGGVFKIPLGLRSAIFIEHYRNQIASQLPRLRENGKLPQRLWLPIGSGTLATIFRELLPREVELVCVNVRVLKSEDPRLEAVRAMPNTRVYEAPETFHEACREIPPVPSNIYYDAKLWPLISKHAQDGDVWWNVAR